MHNQSRAQSLRRLVRFASAAMLFGWFAVFLELGTAAWRHRLFTAVNLYQTVEIFAVTWFVMHMWAKTRQAARSEHALGIRGAWGRAADRVEAVVAKTEKALFRWTPYLCAVFWSLFGVSLSAAMRTKGVLGTREQPLMYFMVAIVLTVILSNGIAEHRPGPDRKSGNSHVG